MTKTSETVARILLSIGAVTLNAKKPYRYASGILSPVYTDCRLLMSFPKERQIVVKLYAKAILDAGKFDVIAGTATAGIPHAAWVSEKMMLPMIYARNKPKDHGKGNLIEGMIKKNQRVAVVEDLISTAQSSAATINAVREQKAIANNIFAITTYGLKIADQTLKKNKIKLTTLTSLTDTSIVAEKIGKISKRDLQLISEWTKDPSTWGNRMGFE